MNEKLRRKIGDQNFLSVLVEWGGRKKKTWLLNGQKCLCLFPFYFIFCAGHIASSHPPPFFFFPGQCFYFLFFDFLGYRWAHCLFLFPFLSYVAFSLSLSLSLSLGCGCDSSFFFLKPDIIIFLINWVIAFFFWLFVTFLY